MGRYEKRFSNDDPDGMMTLATGGLAPLLREVLDAPTRWYCTITDTQTGQTAKGSGCSKGDAEDDAWNNLKDAAKVFNHAAREERRRERTEQQPRKERRSSKDEEEWRRTVWRMSSSGGEARRQDRPKWLSHFMTAIYLIVALFFLTMTIGLFDLAKHNNLRSAANTEGAKLVLAAEAAFREKDFPKTEQLFQEASRIPNSRQMVEERRSTLYEKRVVTVFSEDWSEAISLVEGKYFRVYASSALWVRNFDWRQSYDSWNLSGLHRQMISDVDNQWEYSLGDDKRLSAVSAAPSLLGGGRGRKSALQFKSVGNRRCEITVFITKFDNEQLQTLVSIPNPLSHDFATGRVVVEAKLTSEK